MSSQPSASLNPQQQRFRQAERLRLRHRRNHLLPNEQLAASIQLANQLSGLIVYKQAKTIASYLPDDGEIFTDEIHQRAWANNKSIALPVIQDQQQLQFAHYKDQDTLAAGPWGIQQPKNLAFINDDAIDLVLVPLVGFDQQGNRLGRGGGFYDRFLSRCTSATTVGLAHDFQHIQNLPAANWDIALDFIATPSTAYHCSG
jgi:5-formyltetrahydrofolate cyclo-ligase